MSITGRLFVTAVLSGVATAVLVTVALQTSFVGDPRLTAAVALAGGIVGAVNYARRPPQSGD